MWKVFVFGAFLVRILPHSDWMRTRKNPNTDTFHAVKATLKQFRVLKKVLRWIPFFSSIVSRLGSNWQNLSLTVILKPIDYFRIPKINLKKLRIMSIWCILILKSDIQWVNKTQILYWRSTLVWMKQVIETPCNILLSTVELNPVVNQYQPSAALQIETAHLICSSNQINGFYLKCTGWTEMSYVII